MLEFGRKEICGSAVGHYEPSSGRKVSRESVTKGERGTEKQQKAEAFRCFSVNPSPASREPPLPQGSHGLMQISVLCRSRRYSSDCAEGDFRGTLSGIRTENKKPPAKPAVFLRTYVYMVSAHLCFYDGCPFPLT